MILSKIKSRPENKRPWGQKMGELDFASEKYAAECGSFGKRCFPNVVRIADETAIFLLSGEMVDLEDTYAQVFL